jgi:hypothetical protein
MQLDLGQQPKRILRAGVNPSRVTFHDVNLVATPSRADFGGVNDHHTKCSHWGQTPM